MGKTRRRLEVPLNDTAAAIIAEKQAVKHGPHVFYNPVTGGGFPDLKAGFKAILKRAGLTGITWHTLGIRSLHGRRDPVRALESRYEGRAAAKLPRSDKVVTQVPRKAQKPKAA